MYVSDYKVLGLYGDTDYITINIVHHELWMDDQLKTLLSQY